MFFELSEFLKGAEWTSVTDTVMGGVSNAKLESSPEGVLVFSGRVSLENSGGFASVRTRPQRLDLSSYRGLRLRLRGDGKRYSLNLRTAVSIPGGSYRFGFETLTNVWEEIYLPLEEFKPIAFGSEISHIPEFDPGNLRSIGFMISSGQDGPFRLEVAWMRAVD